MESLSTVPFQNEFNTVAMGEFGTKHRNQKVGGFRCSKIQGEKDSSMSSSWSTIEDYLSYGIASYGIDQISQTCSRAFYNPPEVLEEIISIYKNENIAHNLNINDLFVREYKPHTEINLLHSLVDIGNEIFKDARPRNEVEAKIINDFVRSKTKVISSTQL